MKSSMKKVQSKVLQNKLMIAAVLMCIMPGVLSNIECPQILHYIIAGVLVGMALLLCVYVAKKGERSWMRK